MPFRRDKALLRSLFNKPSVKNFNKSLLLIKKHSYITDYHVKLIVGLQHLPRRPSKMDLHWFLYSLEYHFLELKKLYNDGLLELLSPLLVHLITTKLNGEIWTKWMSMARKDMVDPESLVHMMEHLYEHFWILNHKNNIRRMRENLEDSLQEFGMLEELDAEDLVPAQTLSAEKQRGGIMSQIAKGTAKVQLPLSASAQMLILKVLWKKALSFIHAPTDECYLCHLPHKFTRCYNFLSLRIIDRLHIVDALTLCRNCLTDEHPSSDRCPSKVRCAMCNQAHHMLLHRMQGPMALISQMAILNHDPYYILEYCMIQRMPPKSN